MNKRLTEIELIRPFFIILLVLYHAFIIFAGGWTPVYGYEDVPAYNMIAGVSYSFMLEGFVLMSGYIYGYQVHKNGSIGLLELAKKKTLRLLVPAWIWSLIYGVTLLPYPLSFVELVSGVGHLWFLVMLFWVFIGAWIINKIELPQPLIWITLVLFALLSDNPLPFQLSNAMYYLLFFYFGEKLYDWIIDTKKPLSKCTITQLLINGGGYFLFYAFKIMVSNKLSYSAQDSLLLRMECNVINRLIMILTAIPATLAIVIIGKRLSNHLTPSHIWLKIGYYGMGIYIFQQFILQILYYHTEIPALVGIYLLPWVGFVSALIVSFLITHYMKKLKLGRLILGDKV